MKNLLKNKAAYIVLALVIIVAGILGFRWENKKLNNIEDLNTLAAKSEPINLVPINNDLGLFKQTATDKLNNFNPETKYYDAGTIDEGQFKGWHRIVGYLTVDDPSGEGTILFITKDFQTYLIENGIDGFTKLGSEDSSINANKVTGYADIVVKQSKTIQVDNFVLVRRDIYLDQLTSTNTQKLATINDLTLFAYPNRNQNQNNNEDAPENEKQYNSALNNYFSSDNLILAQDNSGLTYTYLFTSKEAYDRSNKDVNSYISYSNFFLGNEINSKSATYNAYGQPLPGGCGALDSLYLVKNISDNDVLNIGKTKDGVGLFTLKDKNHPLNRAEFTAKVTRQFTYFIDLNKTTPPGYDEYVEKNPILLFKDPWNRWVAMGENQYQMVGGCGKPVIYLYPEKKTEVSVRFIKPIDFTTDIPTYNNGWKVLAYPNGVLKDLQSQFTDCNKIKEVKGSEYAKLACETNSYPYIYWSGQSFAGTYTSSKNGWIVEKNNIESFLNQKLSEIGLNTKEKSDMIDYWAWELKSKNYPYYKISFLQTQELNKLFPMDVSPKPDTTFRIFLDWQPLMEKPQIGPNPQTLNHLDRKGFTLVEWGGLKR